MENLKQEFFKKFPETTKGEFACFVDCSHGEPCVWDTDEPEDCVYASKGIKKRDCTEWKKAQDYNNSYASSDIWEWIEKKLTKENKS